MKAAEVSASVEADLAAPQGSFGQVSSYDHIGANQCRPAVPYLRWKYCILIRRHSNFVVPLVVVSKKVTPGKDTVEEYDFAEYREREGHRMLENGETALRCDVCGAEFFQPAEGTATVCPMCGSPQIKPEEEHNGIPVEGVVPFAIDRYEAQKRFRPVDPQAMVRSCQPKAHLC